MHSIAQVVAELRRQSGLTLREVSQRTGISVSHLSAIERGERQHPSFQNIVEIAKVFGVPLSHFVDEPSGMNGLNIRTLSSLQTIREYDTGARLVSLYEPHIVQFLLTEEAVPYVGLAHQLASLGGHPSTSEVLQTLAHFLDGPLEVE